MKRRLKCAEPYVAPPGSPPLREVVLALGEKTKQLGALDTQISDHIKAIEARLREKGLERIISVKLPDGANLGWSRDRRRRLWRLVIRTEDEALDLLSCPREERAEVFTCGAMERLLQRALS